MSNKGLRTCEKVSAASEAPRDRSLEHIEGSPSDIALALHNDAVKPRRIIEGKDEREPLVPMPAKSAHTPGPWQFYADTPSTDPNWHIVTNASRLRVIANVHIEPGNEVDEANARLIAAAPELLAASGSAVAAINALEGVSTIEYPFALKLAKSLLRLKGVIARINIPDASVEGRAQ